MQVSKQFPSPGFIHNSINKKTSAFNGGFFVMFIFYFLLSKSTTIGVEIHNDE